MRTHPIFIFIFVPENFDESVVKERLCASVAGQSFLVGAKSHQGCLWVILKIYLSTIFAII